VEQRRATLSSVADRAAVSRQTVSNVLNAPHLVRTETRQRVEAVIDELHYRPHRGARSLRTRRSQLVGVRMDPFRDGVNGSVLDRFLHALTEASEAKGYRVLLFTAPDDDAEITAYDDLLDTHDLDAFVLTSTHHGDRRTAWLADRGVPFVTFGRPWGAHARHSWVDVDGAAGTLEATGRLTAAGHRRIAFLGWPAGSGVGDDRLSGWRTAMEAAGLPTDGLIARGDDGYDSGREATERLLAAGDVPTAYVCASDSLACGALAALSAARTPAGPDLPVIGFDDTPVAPAVGLSSCAQPLAEVAEACIRLLDPLIRPEAPRPTEPSHVLLPPRFILRRTGG
jgi:DNA-binding LacI/PurR family transcriptional regulator